MRKFFLIIAFAGTLSLCSCSDWFDISPKTDMKAAELFETENGFMEALAGIYITMTEDNLYGGNLSFGMLDQLAQEYDYIPDGATELADIYNYTTTTSGGYDTKGKQADTWLSAYNIIANVNNLLKWLDSKGENVITNEQTRNMIRGEALAIRAYVHFDLLRLWGPIYNEEPDTKSIPYRTSADKEKLPRLKASEVAQKILADLSEAKQLLSYESNVSLSDNERRFRFNYHAVVAEMARVYCYIGDSANALTAAKEVINGCGLELQVSNSDDPILFDETIVGVNLYKMSDNITSHFAEGPKFTSQYFSSTQTINSIFESSGTSADVDMRAKTSAILRYSDQQKCISRKYIKNDNAVIPLIRLPEMYYIMCEMSDLADAPQYINTVRNKRGYSATTNYSVFTDSSDRTSKLDKEYRKEFYAEGQYFYFLKRNHMTTFINCPLDSMGADEYVFPLPDNEQEYGWTDDEENSSSSTTDDK